MKLGTSSDGGVIRAGEVYLLEEFHRRAGIGRHAYNTARHRGLKVIRTAGRVYVRGDDWLAYLESVVAQAAE